MSPDRPCSNLDVRVDRIPTPLSFDDQAPPADAAASAASTTAGDDGDGRRAGSKPADDEQATQQGRRLNRDEHTDAHIRWNRTTMSGNVVESAVAVS